MIAKKPLRKIPTHIPNEPKPERRFSVFIRVLNDGSTCAKEVFTNDDLGMALGVGRTRIHEILDKDARYVGWVRVWDNQHNYAVDFMLFFVQAGKRIIHRIDKV